MQFVKWHTVSLCAVLLLGGVTACGDGASDTTRVGSEASSPDESSDPSGSEDSALLDTVHRFSTALGEPNPEQIQWVRTTSRNEVARLMTGRDNFVGNDDIPVVVAFATGRFSAMPDGVAVEGVSTTMSDQMHPYLYLVLDEATGEPVGHYVDERLVDLSRLGEVHQG